MKCWMCRKRKVKSIGRCKTCRETRCIECGQDLAVFVGPLHAVNLRKKQWEHSLYERRALVKTRTFEASMREPGMPEALGSEEAPPSWLPVPKAKAPPKKESFDDAITKVEQE